MNRNTSGLRRGGGRTPGVPNRATREARAFLQDLLDEAHANPEFKQNLLRGIVQLSIPHQTLRLIFEYAYGRVPYALQLGDGKGDRTLEELVSGFIRPDPDSDEEDHAEQPTVPLADACRRAAGTAMKSRQRRLVAGT
jgi:hypothetical protein